MLKEPINSFSRYSSYTNNKTCNLNYGNREKRVSASRKRKEHVSNEDISCKNWNTFFSRLSFGSTIELGESLSQYARSILGFPSSIYGINVRIYIKVNGLILILII